MILDNALHPDKAGQKLLYVLFTAALDHRFEAGQAEAFGIWTLCYVQYCQHENVPADAPHLPGFLAMLRDHPEVAEEDRNRALDAVMFALFDVFNGKIDVDAAIHMVQRESGGTAASNSGTTSSALTPESSSDTPFNEIGRASCRERV